MGTLADLKSRIIAETTRDDLSDDLASDLNTVIADAIEYFAAERWWFNEGRATSNCTIGQSTSPVPAGVRQIDKLFLVVGGTRQELRAGSVADIDFLYSTPTAGQPTDYALLGANLYLWPTPNAAYLLLWDAIQDVAPALDFSAAPNTQSNAWTSGVPAQLIIAQAKIRLYRDYLSAVESDPRLHLAVGQAAEAYSRLKGETNRRLSTGRIRPARW